MKYAEAMDIINFYEKRVRGFLVAFEKKDNGMLVSDSFPDKQFESVIPTEEEAWKLAKRFADAAAWRYTNIYVVYAEDYTPVPDYKNKAIKHRILA